MALIPGGTHVSYKERFELESQYLELLKPYKCSSKIRIGRQGDGGYILNPHHIPSTCFSYGVGRPSQCTFEKDYIDHHGGKKVFMYDGTVDFKPPRKEMVFRKENVYSHPSVQSHWYLNCSHDPGDFLLMMDIEGWELRILKDLSETYMSRAAQINIEYHFRMKTIMQPPFRPQDIISSLERMNVSHSVIHIHGNNSAMTLLPGNLPSVVEVTYLRKDLLGEHIIEDSAYPIPNLDSPNMKSRPDQVIDFWINP